MMRGRLGVLTAAVMLSAAATLMAQRRPAGATGGEILRVVVQPNPIVMNGSQLGAFDVLVNGRGTCDHVVIYIKLPDDPPPSGGAWDSDQTNVVFSSDSKKTGTVTIGGKGSFSEVGTSRRVVWAYPAPDSKNCHGRARTIVTVEKQS